jgi:rhamnulokinase
MPEAASWLAFDLGAESGRAFAGTLDQGVLSVREVHRFANVPVEYEGALHWDTPRLWTEILKALCQEHRKWDGIAIDSWGVDYALLDESGELIRHPYHYRDPRNQAAMAKGLAQVSKAEIYRETGIQFLPINTLYQLFAAKCRAPNLLACAKHMLMIPDLFHYWLTGRAICEYTNATTTQLVNPVTRSWSGTLIDRFGFPRHLFGEIVEPGNTIGHLRRGVAPGCSFSGIPVIAPASHDTASAVASVTARGNTVFLSSGTWSLLGIEVDRPMISADALRLNFTNEGGVGLTTRLLKNVMGLWMLQACRKSWSARGIDCDYAALIEHALLQPAFATLIDPDDPSFLNPPDMPEAIDQFSRKTGQPRPRNPAAYTRAILESLALKYRSVIAGIEELTGNRIEQIRVIGGGSKNRCLNQFTADAAGRRVLAGPTEAAALGNLGIQMLATGAANSLEEVRAVIDRSFPTEVYEPVDPEPWRRHAERFEQYCEFTYA